MSTTPMDRGPLLKTSWHSQSQRLHVTYGNMLSLIITKAPQDVVENEHTMNPIWLVQDISCIKGSKFQNIDVIHDLLDTLLGPDPTRQ